MAEERLRLLIRRLRHLADPSAAGALADAQLLERFVASRDEAAFELLVWRHGAMVLSLCRRLLRHEQDAEDAFQATFLTLARKAASIRKSTSLASWLYKVAYRAALAARADTARRASREQPCVDVPGKDGAEDAVWRDVRLVLDEEVNGLPEKFRAAFVLCHLEGKTNEEAAELLGCPKGTILSRLARARERLRLRLTRRGVTLSAGALAAVAAGAGQAAAVSVALVEKTILAAQGFAAGKAAAGLVSDRAAALTEEVIRAMLMKKVKVVLGVALAVGLFGLGAGALSQNGGQGGGADEAGGGRNAPPARRMAAEKGKPPADAARPTDEEARRRDSLRRLSENNLKQIGIALHTYHDVYGHFPPPAIYDRNGKPLLSWRVALLPFLEQDNLYKQFKLDEPWDSAHNKPLARLVLKVYAPVDRATPDPSLTYYQVFVGKGTVFEKRQGGGAGGGMMMGPGGMMGAGGMSGAPGMAGPGGGGPPGAAGGAGMPGGMSPPGGSAGGAGAAGPGGKGGSAPPSGMMPPGGGGKGGGMFGGGLRPPGGGEGGGPPPGVPMSPGSGGKGGSSPGGPSMGMGGPPGMGMGGYGPGAMAPAGASARAGVMITEITDGTSNTIAVVEAATPVPWSKPEDLPFVEDQALPKLGGLFGGDFNVLSADGAVHFLTRDADPAALRLAITRDDGQVLDWTKIEAAPRRNAAATGSADTDTVGRENQRLKEILHENQLLRDRARKELEHLKGRLEEEKVSGRRDALLAEQAELKEGLELSKQEIQQLWDEIKKINQELDRLQRRKR